MELIRHGHACFSLQDHLDRVWLFDPYRPQGLGGRFNLPLPKLKPTGILSTHSHEDHAWRSAEWRNVPFYERDFTLNDLRLRCISVAHDGVDGARMGFSRVMRLEVDFAPGRTLTLVHAGDASDVHNEALQSHCSKADVLILPAGGTYTMGPEKALDLARSSQARCAILTHFREPGIDLPMLSPDEAFNALDASVLRVDSGRLELPLTEDVPELLWLKAQMAPKATEA